MSRYIEYEPLMAKLEREVELADDWKTAHEIANVAKYAPSIDIVRCQDCKYWVYNFNGCARNPCTEPWYALDFCNYGEREGE